MPSLLLPYRGLSLYCLYVVRILVIVLPGLGLCMCFCCRCVCPLAPLPSLSSPLLRRLLIPFTGFIYLFQVGMLDKNSKVYASDHRAVFGRFRITHTPTAKEEKE